MYGHQDLHWKDSRLYLGSCATGNSITPDIKYPSMWRVRYPGGSLSDIVNLTRARDGARCLATAASGYPTKISGASRRGSLTLARTSPSVHSVQRLENINNLYPSLRLDGKASGQRLTEIGRI